MSHMPYSKSSDRLRILSPLPTTLILSNVLLFKSEKPLSMLGIVKVFDFGKIPNLL